MKHKLSQPYYEKIAIDIASRILNDEFKQGTRLLGISTMASQYKTSSETVRKSLRLLSDMKVVDVMPQRGSIVLSKDNAKRYLNTSTKDETLKVIFDELINLRNEYDQLNSRLANTMTRLEQSRFTFVDAEYPLPNYEIAVPEGSNLNGKSIGCLNFWQNTGATIIAIRRGKNVLISPGPSAELYERDIVILIGNAQAVNKAKELIEGGIIQ